MSIMVYFDGSLVEFHNFHFDPENSSFTSDADHSTGVTLSVQSPLRLDPTFEGRQFHVHFLSKKNLRENDIFQVHSEQTGKRIGWCIPVNALDSVEHDHATNTHFLRYAYIGLKLALGRIERNLFTTIPHIDGDATCLLSDILPESTALLVISQETLETQFALSTWLPALAALGYFQLTGTNPDNITIDFPRVEGNKATIAPISDDVAYGDFLGTIYSRSFPFERQPIFQFFYLYQIIEFLMELVFKNEQACLVRDIVAAKEDTSATKDILERVSKNASEKRRIALLVREYCRCDAEAQDIISTCNNILKFLGRQEGTEVATTLYAVRNLLFHRFHDFPPIAESLLSDVIYSFLSFLAKLLANFHVPATEDASPDLATSN